MTTWQGSQPNAQEFVDHHAESFHHCKPGRLVEANEHSTERTGSGEVSFFRLRKDKNECIHTIQLICTYTMRIGIAFITLPKRRDFSQSNVDE
jgi:hypothetical protein